MTTLSLLPADVQTAVATLHVVLRRTPGLIGAQVTFDRLHEPERVPTVDTPPATTSQEPT